MILHTPVHEEPTPGPNACIRLHDSQTKSGDAREFPIGKAPELLDLLLERFRHSEDSASTRDFRRARVSEGKIMKLCGWKTRDMFDRYSIIDSAGLSRVVAQCFNGKVTAKKVMEE